MRDPLGPPPPARHPDTVFLLALCLFSGLLQLSGAPSNSIATLLPTWLTASWAALLIVGAATTLAGVFWRNRVTGLLLELAGRVCFAPAALIYSGAVIVVTGITGVLAAAPFLGFAASSLWRVTQIHASVVELRSIMATMTWAQNHRDEP